MDANREEDGIDLRYRFITEVGIPKNYQEVYAYLDGPCSVLEMMIALAIRCEESIMDDPDIGDRTSEWFWLMMKNLGLDYMSDRKFDRDIAEEKISIFLDRRYKRNGEGGLFVRVSLSENVQYALRLHPRRLYPDAPPHHGGGGSDNDRRQGYRHCL